MAKIQGESIYENAKEKDVLPKGITSSFLTMFNVGSWKRYMKNVNRVAIPSHL